MLKDMSNPSFLEITTIAHELLDYERISLRLRKNGSCRSLNELLRQVAFDIQDSKDETFDELRQEHALDTLRRIRTTLQDLGYGQVTGRKDYLTPLDTALRDKELDSFNTTIIYFSVAQISGIPITVHLNGSDIFLRYDCPAEFYWNPRNQSSALDKLDVTDLEQISIELTTEHIIAMHHVVKAHYFQSKDDHESAIQYANSAINEFPGYWLAHKIKGISLEQTGELRTAIQSYADARFLNLSDDDTLRLLEAAVQKREKKEFDIFSAIMSAGIRKRI